MLKGHNGTSLGACEVSPEWRKRQRKKAKARQKALDEKQKRLSSEVRVRYVDPDTLK